MNYILGKYKSSIYESDSGYKIGLFKVQETDDEEIKTNKTITFTGYFAELNNEDTYKFYGNYIFHDRYGYQFQVNNYEKVIPEGKEAIIDFLTSPFVKGCGEKTAQKIYDTFKDETLEKIKESKDNLFLVEGLTERRINTLYNSIIKYFDSDKEIIALKNMGFTIKETMTLISIYGKKVLEIINNNIYILRDTIDFPKLDKIFLDNNDKEDPRRIRAAIIESMKQLSFRSGDIFLDKIEIVEYLTYNYKINVNIDDYLVSFYNTREIMIIDNDYYLMEDYLDEDTNANCITYLLNKEIKPIKKFNELIGLSEKELNINYNDEQIKAIKMGLENSISVITGGPGTGKTTIIKGIIKIYSIINKLDEIGISKNIMLLAPTGRASKRMSETTGIGSSTIHRFLKWDKESNTFGINELNPLHYNLIIIDETSMIDNHLLASLFRGIDLNTQIVFVGDKYQLPSVGPGLILEDLIKTSVPSITLEHIYRQSENSFIPILAREIKDMDLTEDFLNKKDDYNFITADNKEIKSLIKQILSKIIEKNIDVSKIQILAPMYKGENGIDSLNILLQEIFNPASIDKEEISLGPIKYREGDKILNLVNDTDLNISNGDIGYIEEINPLSKVDYVIVDYYGNKVSYRKDHLSNITHAYAISIHKSQGSEFEHVIMPISNSFKRMLYNKLLYTGVSRAKKSLVLIGSPEAFNECVHNNYSYIRKTSLKQKIMNNINKKS